MIGDSLAFREACRADVPVMVDLLADDTLGRLREAPDDLSIYHAAFDVIAQSANETLLLAVRDGAVLGMLQLSFIPGLAQRGAWRAQIEAVRVAAAARGQRIGEALIHEAIRRARERGCSMVQLTSDKRRHAHRFYLRLGFAASHEGFKLAL